MSKFVLDSSAVLAFIFDEPGSDRVQAVRDAAMLGTVNYAEVVGKLRDRSMTQDDIDAIFARLRMEIVSFTRAQGQLAGDLRPLTRSLGLSLGDRACLALAIELGATALTADRAWAQIPEDTLAGARVEVFR